SPGPTATSSRSGEPARGRRPGRRLGFGGLLAVLLGLVGWVAPPPPGLPVAGWHALATLAALVPLLVLDVLPDGVLALLLPALWVLGGVASPRVALSGFASPSWVLVVSVLAVGAAIASCGLLYRLSLWLVTHARGGFAAHVIALACAGVVIGPAVPNATGRVALIAPALTELVTALGYAPGSREAAGAAMAPLMAFGQMTACFLTSSTTAVLVFAVLPEAARRDLTWLSWTVRTAPTNALLLIGLVTAVAWLYRPRSEAARAAPSSAGALALQRALLGP